MEIPLACLELLTVCVLLKASSEAKEALIAMPFKIKSLAPKDLMSVACVNVTGFAAVKLAVTGKPRVTRPPLMALTVSPTGKPGPEIKSPTARPALEVGVKVVAPTDTFPGSVVKKGTTVALGDVLKEELI